MEDRAITVYRYTLDTYEFRYKDHHITFNRSDFPGMSEAEFLKRSVKTAFEWIDEAENAPIEMEIGEERVMFEPPKTKAAKSQDFAFVCRHGDVG